MSDDLLIFTRTLSALCGSDLSFPLALQEIWTSDHYPKKVKKCALEIHSKLDSGIRISSALSGSAWIYFPQWYLSFMTVAEEGGKVAETLAFLLSLLEERRKVVRNFLLALCYPLVISLACLAFALYLPSLFDGGAGHALWAGGTVGPAAEEGGALFGANCFLLSMLLLAVFALTQVMKVDQLSLLLHSLSFLTSSSVSLIRSLETSLPIVSSDRRLYEAVEEISRSLLTGVRASVLFSSALEKKGFSEAARVCALELSLSESGARTNPFESAEKILSENRKMKKKAVLALEQPFMLCVCALYMALVLKDRVIPLLFPVLGF